MLTGQPYDLPLNPNGGKATAAYILSFSVAWFLGASVFSFFWKKRFNEGPMELLMRRLSG
jgi:uncharacterized membrane protein YeiB